MPTHRDRAAMNGARSCRTLRVRWRGEQQDDAGDGQCEGEEVGYQVAHLKSPWWESVLGRHSGRMRESTRESMCRESAKWGDECHDAAQESEKMDSIGRAKSRAIRNANGREGSYLPVSMALTD